MSSLNNIKTLFLFGIALTTPGFFGIGCSLDSRGVVPDLSRRGV